MRWAALVLLICAGCIVIPASADLPSYFHVVKETVYGYSTVTMNADFGGPTIVRNSSGAIYTTFANMSDSLTANAYISLAWTTDNGTTWSESAIPQSSLLGVNGNIMVDSNDTIHMIYARGEPGVIRPLYYRNYTLSSGWGLPIQLTAAGVDTYYAASVMDDTETIHVVWIDNNMDIKYVNVSTNNGIDVGDSHDIRIGISDGYYPMLDTDNDGTVHIIFSEANIPGGVNPNNNLEYLNLSSSGWSQIYRMIDDPNDLMPEKIIVDENKTLHVLYVDSWVTGNLYYSNASGSNNFQLLPPVILAEGGAWEDGQAMSIDMNGTLHFIYVNETALGGYQLTYRNFTTSGLGSEYYMDTTRVTADVNTFYSHYPYGNILASGSIFMFANESAGHHWETVEYGTFPDVIFASPTSAPTPTPTPTTTSPWTSSTKSSEYIQGVIEMGIYVFILAAVVMLVVSLMQRW